MKVSRLCLIVRVTLKSHIVKFTEVRTNPSSPGQITVGDVAMAGGGGGNDGSSEEKYEKGIPMHGDIMFHNFLVTLEENPEQILRLFIFFYFFMFIIIYFSF